MNTDLTDMVALVTIGNSGIGRVAGLTPPG